MRGKPEVKNQASLNIVHLNKNNLLFAKGVRLMVVGHAPYVSPQRPFTNLITTRLGSEFEIRLDQYSMRRFHSVDQVDPP